MINYGGSESRALLPSCLVRHRPAHGARPPQKRIPPSLFSRVVKKLPSLLPRAVGKRDRVEDEASVDWIGEALRPPDAPVDDVVGQRRRRRGISRRSDLPDPSMAASPEDAACVLSESWPFAAPAPAPAPAPGRATPYTPGRVTWGADVFGGAATPGRLRKRRRTSSSSRARRPTATMAAAPSRQPFHGRPPHDWCDPEAAIL